jgi:hypothetical protein
MSITGIKSLTVISCQPQPVKPVVRLVHHGDIVYKILHFSLIKEHYVMVYKVKGLEYSKTSLIRYRLIQNTV